jgi:hypothetical protein
MLAVAAGVLALLTVPALAHHSFSSFWQLDKTVAVTGVVKTFKLINPHPEMTVEVTEADGRKAIWTITARGTGTGMIRGGWKKDWLTAGETVKVEGAPSKKEGAKAIAAGKITKSDGKEIWFGGGGGIPTGD